MKITVLCGGTSNERDVSISSGTGIAAALRKKGHAVALVDLFTGVKELPADINQLFLTGETNDASTVAERAPDVRKLKAARRRGELIGPHVLDLCRAADVTFLALHGEEGENGKLQGLLDIYRIRYTGSSCLGSAIAMNKGVSKTLLKAAGVPVPEGLVLRAGETTRPAFGFPCVVKPCSGGSSVGTAVGVTEENYEAALAEAFCYEDRVLVEPYIRGREITVGVLDGKAMPSIEIIPKSGFYDYKNKYQSGFTTELCPAPLTPEQNERAARLAELAFAALQMKAYGRVDFIMDESGEFYCLEANTLPGMTPTSLVPQMGAAMGMDFGALCEKLIEVSMRKYQ